jgi:hypothetical protein
VERESLPTLGLEEENMPSISRRPAILMIGAAIMLPRAALAAPPAITVHKDPNCGCCSGWVAHLELRGYRAKVIETAALSSVKAKLGVPFDLASCHTGEIAGYVVEGHVPAPAIEKLLRERPKARGLAVPGMPSGSPGMTGDYEEYDVILFGPDQQRVYGRFKGEQEI